MTLRRDPIERVTDWLQDLAIAHAPIAVLVVAGVALFVSGVIFTLYEPFPGLPGRLLIFGPIAIGSASLGLARWVRAERRYLLDPEKQD